MSSDSSSYGYAYLRRPAKVRSGGIDDHRVVQQEPNGDVAVPAEQATHVTSVVAVIDDQHVAFASAYRRPTTNGAQPALGHSHRLKLGKGDPVEGPELGVQSLPRCSRGRSRRIGATRLLIRQAAGHTLSFQPSSSLSSTPHAPLCPSFRAVDFMSTVQTNHLGTRRPSLLTIEAGRANAGAPRPAGFGRSALLPFRLNGRGAAALGACGAHRVTTAHATSAGAPALITTHQRPCLVSSERRQGLFAFRTVRFHIPYFTTYFHTRRPK